MLECLTIRNFQANRQRHIDLGHPIVNLVGPSDCGKTAALRALIWVALNSPSGSEFMSWDAENVRVALTVDGKTIVRKIGKTGNLYIMDGEEYRAFGMGKVPDAIAAVLNIDASNFQQQEDQRFWLSETSGTVAKELNQIINLEIIDETLEKSAKAIRHARAVVVVSEGRLAEARTHAAALEWTVDAAARLGRVEAIAVRHGARATRIDSLASLLHKARIAEARRQDASTAVLTLAKAVSVADRIMARQAVIETLENLLELAKQCAKIIAARELVSGMAVRLGRMIERRQQADKLAGLYNKLQAAQKALGKASMAARDAAQEFADKTKGQQCPVCGSQL